MEYTHRNENVLDLLKKLISIDSRNPFQSRISQTGEWIIEGNETKISEFIIEQMKQAEFKVEKQFVHKSSDGCEFHNILGEKGTGESSILFYAHMDTVTSNPWLSEKDALTPVKGKISHMGEKIDVITGLGSNDMKAGIAVMLNAFRDIEPQGFKLKLAFGVDEEFYSLGGNVLSESSFMDDVKAVIVPEIGDGPNACYGPATICIGRLGRCEFWIHVPGTGGHGADSMNPKLVNAATECSKIVCAIEELRESINDEFTFFNEKVNDEKAINKVKGSLFVSRIDAGDGTLSVPCNGKIIVDWTMTPSLSIEKGHSILNDMITRLYRDGKLKKTIINGSFVPVKVELAPKPTLHNDAFLTSENDPFVVFCKDTIDKLWGFRNYNMGYSVADENIISRLNPDIPVVVLGPHGKNCHQNGEWVSIESVLKLQELYQTLINNFGNYLSNS